MVDVPTLPTTALVDARMKRSTPLPRDSSSRTWVIVTFWAKVCIGASTERSTEVSAARWTTAVGRVSKAEMQTSWSARSPVTTCTPSSQDASGGSRSTAVTGTPRCRRPATKARPMNPAAPVTSTRSSMPINLPSADQSRDTGERSATNP